MPGAKLTSTLLLLGWQQPYTTSNCDRYKLSNLIETYIEQDIVFFQGAQHFTGQILFLTFMTSMDFRLNKEVIFLSAQLQYIRTYCLSVAANP